MMSKIKTYVCALLWKRVFATLPSDHRSSRSRSRYHWSANWTSTIVTPSPPLTTTTTKVTGHSLGTMFSSSSPTYLQFTANIATQCAQASRKKMRNTNEHTVNWTVNTVLEPTVFFVYYMIPPTGGCYLLLLEYLHHNRYLLLPTTNFKCWIHFHSGFTFP